MSPYKSERRSRQATRNVCEFDPNAIAGESCPSTAMLIAMFKRGIRPDIITFADVGGEKPGTYEFIPLFTQWLRDRDFPGDDSRCMADTQPQTQVSPDALEALEFQRYRLRPANGSSAAVQASARPFDQHLVFIGSAPDNDCVVEHPTVSRVHASKRALPAWHWATPAM